MSITEEIAHTKWCPFMGTESMASEMLLIRRREEARGGGGYCVTGDSLSYQESNRCIASGCMAWRWKVESSHIKNGIVETLDVSTTHGFCGLMRAP